MENRMRDTMRRNKKIKRKRKVIEKEGVKRMQLKGKEGG
jgi:hypothetical protein